MQVMLHHYKRLRWVVEIIWTLSWPQNEVVVCHKLCSFGIFQRYTLTLLWLVITNAHYNVFTGSNCLLISIYLSQSSSICPLTVGTETVIQFTPDREILALLEEVLCVRLEGMLEQCTQEAMRNWYGLLDREIYSIPRVGSHLHMYTCSPYVDSVRKITQFVILCSYFCGYKANTM